MHDVLHCLDVRGADPGEALIGPAQGVRRYNNVVELQQRIVGIRGFLRQDVKPGAGDAPRGKALVSAA